MARVSVTAISMMEYMDPAEAAQVVQLLQGGTLVHSVARRFTMCPIEEIPGHSQLLQESWAEISRTLSVVLLGACSHILAIQTTMCHFETVKNVQQNELSCHNIFSL